MIAAMIAAMISILVFGCSKHNMGAYLLIYKGSPWEQVKWVLILMGCLFSMGAYYTVSTVALRPRIAACPHPAS